MGERYKEGTGNRRSYEATVSQFMQLHPQPGDEETALIALELRPQGPAMVVGGFKGIKNNCEQGRPSWYPQFPSQTSIFAHFTTAVKDGASGETDVQNLP